MDAATKDEIANLIKQVLATFTTQYVKFFALGLVKKAEAEAGAEPGPDWKLTPRPEEGASKEALKCGFLTKEGAIRKSWKKRWFVVQPNYTVEYYESEKAAQAPKPKPKGVMHLAGYRVIEDPNAGIITALEKLADQMKMDISELPKPKKYPDLVFEVHHPRRRSYFIEASTPEEKKEWMAMFRTVCWYAWGLQNRDPVHVMAFECAVRETRWNLGRWGYWGGQGSEAQILSDLIGDELEYATIGKVMSKLSGPWIIRSKVRDQTLKIIDTMVSAAVTPAWTAMNKTVEELRPKIEPTIATSVDPIGKQKAELNNKLKDGCLGIINPLLDQHVTPHLSKILDIIKSPVVGGYETAAQLLETQFTQFAGKFNASQPEANFRDLDYWARWSWWEARAATEKFEVMYEPLWALREIFSGIYPWSSIYNGQDALRKMLDNAVWTYQLELKKAVAENNATPCDTAKQVTLDKFREDAKIATFLFYLGLFKAVIMPALVQLVVPACKAIIEPLASIIPDLLKQFIDPNDMFDKLLNGIVDDAIKNVLK